MSTIYVPSTAPSTSSVDSRASSVTYPSPFSQVPHRPLRRPFPFEYDDFLDPMFDSKYRRNYDRVHRASYGLQSGAMTVMSPAVTGGYYPYTGSYPYAGYGAGYPQVYPQLGMGMGIGSGMGMGMGMGSGMGMGMGMGATYDPMLAGYDCDYPYRGMGGRMRPGPWGRRRMMLDRYHDTDDDFY